MCSSDLAVARELFAGAPEGKLHFVPVGGDEPAKYDASIHYGAARYLDGLSVDEETGELLECARVVVFDEARLEEERRLDGYYVVITSETSMSDDDVIDT